MSNPICMLLMMILLGLGFQDTYSQSSDALNASVQKLKAADESTYAQILDEIFEGQQNLGFDTAKTNLEALLKVAEKLPFKNAIPAMHRMLGQLHQNHKLNADAFAYYEEALKHSRKYNLLYEQAQAKGSLGALMQDQFKINEAVTYFLEAADLFNQHGYLAEANKMYMRLGSINYENQNFRRAIDYYERVYNSTGQASSAGEKMFVANNIGLAFYQKNELDNALLYYNKALDIAYALPDSFYIGLVSGNAGMIYLKKGNIEEAIDKFQKDLRLSKKYEEWESTAVAMVNMATAYQKKENYTLAGNYLDSAQQVAHRLDNTRLSRMVYEANVQQYQQQQNYQKAFENLSLVEQLNDTINRQLQKQRAAEIDAAYNFDKNLAEIDYLLENNRLQSLIIIVFAVSTALLLLLAIMLGKLIRQRAHANRILALQKQDIEQRNITLEAQKDRIMEQNETMGHANRQISLLNEKLNQKVRFSEEILRSAYENASEAFFILRAVREREKLKYFVCLGINQAAAQLLNRPKDEIVGESLINLLPFLSANRYFDAFIKVYSENLNFDHELYVGQEGNFPEWVQIMANPIEGGIAIKIKNITRRKEQEQLLKEREASISAMINNTTDLILSIDTSFRLTEFNEPFAKTVEINSGFIPTRGQSVFEAVHEQNIQESRKNLETALSGESVSNQYDIPSPDGNIVYAEAFFSPVLLDKQPIGATVVIRNITNRKKNEINLKEALNKVQESENFLNEIIENLPVGLQIYDAQCDLIRMNGAQLELLGMSEVMPKQINVLKEPFYKVYGIDDFFAQAYQGSTMLNQEVLIDMGNPSDEWKAFNQKAWLSISTIPVKDKNGFVKSVIGLCSDITERKEAEVALRESEERLRMVINNIPIILWTTDKDGIFTMSEGKALEKMSLYPGQIVGISIFDFFTDHKEPLYALKDAIEKGINYEDIERIGKTIFNSKVFPLCNDQGEITGMIGMSIDVTERVEYEEKLKRSESNLNAIINNTNYSIWSVDTAFRVIAVNNIFREAFKTAFEVEFEVGEDALHHIPKEQAQLWSASYQKTLQGAHHTFEYTYMGMFYDVSMYPIISDGQITGVAVFSLDVTERKQTENQIRENQQFLNGIIDNMPIGLQIFDKIGSLTRINRAFQHIMHLPDLQHGIGRWNILESKISGKLGISSLAARAYGGETFSSEEVKLNFNKGENLWDTHKANLWHNITMFPIYNKDEEIKAVVVLTEDITERKRTEEKLQQQQQEIIETNKIIAEYKLMALRSVMNPHFLFNSLNSIQYFIAKNEREMALNYLSLFSKLIRGVLNSSVNATIPLSHELEVLKYYIELEALRFENKFEPSFVIDEDIDLENIEIPSLLIQPYVENAIIHGLYNKTGAGKLTISLSQQNGLLKCLVEDNGVGRKEALRIKKRNAIRHNSIGMMVTKERLNIINKTHDVSVNIYDLKNKEAKPMGTRVEIFVHI